VIVIDETHAPALRSWVDSANQPQTDFPIQNLPFGVFQRDGQEPRCGVRIGDQVLDLAALAGAQLIDPACAGSSLNLVMALSSSQRQALRQRLSALLQHGTDDRAMVEPHLVAVSQVVHYCQR
jgi:fumarylacetoacetase